MASKPKSDRRYGAGAGRLSARSGSLESATIQPSLNLRRTSLDFYNAVLVHSTKPVTASKPPAVHRWHEITYVCNGEYMARTARVSRTGRAGEMFFYPAGTPHQSGGVPKTKAELLCLMWLDPHLRPHDLPAWRFDLRGRLRILLDWMWELCPPQEADEAANVDPSTRELLVSLLHAFLTEYATGSAFPRTGMLQRIHHYAIHALQTHVTLQHLAQVASMNRHAFARRFHNLTGITPMAYVRRIRVKKAVQLLKTTALPLKTIAIEVGAGNKHLLARWIRRETGATSSEIRRDIPPLRKTPFA